MGGVICQMLHELISRQRQSLDHFFDELQLDAIHDLLDRLLACRGTLFFTGIGKSGLIAKKIAHTMVSTGTRAATLSAVDALHGDLGSLSSDDFLLALSKSGESDELLQLIPAVRSKGATSIAVVCRPATRLSALCDHHIILPFENELCPFDMAPTTSTTAQLLWGDLLAIALMKRRQFSVQQYALNHPSGQIGRRLLLRVKDVMLTGERIPRCLPHERLREGLVELSNKRCGCILVVDATGRLIGLFTDGDLRRTLQRVADGVLNLSIGEVMNPHPHTIGVDRLAWEALQQMEAHPLKRLSVLPVIDAEGYVAGILHIHDLIQSGI